MLAEKVTGLLPLEERLPKEPLVIVHSDELVNLAEPGGEYGRPWRSVGIYKFNEPSYLLGIDGGEFLLGNKS